MFSLPGYSVLEELHSGKKSLVFRGVREQDRTPVILKSWRGGYPATQAKARLRHEYRLLSSLNSQFFPQAYALEEQQSRVVLVLEDIGGLSLDKWFPAGEKVQLESGLELALQLAEALELIHDSGLIHKDINASNIVLNPAGQLQMIDFGIASRSPSPKSF